MTFKKHVGALLLIVVFLLSGCSFSGTDETNGSAESNEAVKEEIVSKVKAVENEIGQYILSIQNNKSEAATLEMKSSQQFDYHIRDINGDILHTYSTNKSFAMVSSEKVLGPGEKLEIPVDITEFLPDLKAGTYSLEVWPASVNGKDLLATITFDYDGTYKASSKELLTIAVIYQGLMDNHSFEAINRNGEPVAFRIPESLRTLIKDLETGDTIHINYSVNEHNQKIVESIAKEE